MPLMNQVEYAKHAGISQPRVSKMIKSGVLEPALRKEGKNTRIHSDVADRILSENISQIQRNAQAQAKNKNNPPSKEEMVAQVKAAGTGSLTLSEAQRIQAQYKAGLLKLEYEEKSGLLIKQDQVVMDFFNIARTTRDAMLNIPNRIAPELAAVTDQHIINQKLTQEINAALEELSR